MKRINEFILILLLSAISFPLKSASSLNVYPQTDPADFHIGNNIVGWKVPITIGTDVFAGLKIVAVVSISSTPRNGMILSLGSGADGGKSMEYGISFFEAGDQIKVVRKVKVRGEVKDHETYSWNRDLIRRSTDYILTVEIDETRFRYSLAEVKNPSNIKYEYQYDGLSPTYVREQMVKNGIYVAVDRYNYLAQKLEVTELGYGVGVKPITPGPYTRYGRLKETNSGMYLSRYGATYIRDYFVQKPRSATANDKFRITDLAQSNRTPLSFNVIPMSQYRDIYIGPRNCMTADGAYIYEMPETDCNVWSVNTAPNMRPLFFFRNYHSGGYMTVENSSTQAGAYIVQKTNIQDGSKWEFEPAKNETKLKEGYYSFVNAKSDMYAVVYWKGYYSLSYIVQSPTDYSDCNAWYVSLLEDGTYRIRNVDTNGYMGCQGGYFDKGTYVVQSYGLSGSAEKWTLKNIEDKTYYITSFCSGLNMGVRYESVVPYEYLVLNDNSGLSYQWNADPVDFYAGEDLYGFYQIQDVNSGKFLAVEGGSTAAASYLVLKDSAEDPSAWWSITQDNNGPYVIKNVKSHLCATVRGRSSSSGEYIVQYPFPNKNRGHMMWRLRKGPSPNVYYISSVFDGLYMTVQGHYTYSGAYIIQKLPNGGAMHPDPQMQWRLIHMPYGASQQ